jgi:hypothetical protein
MSGLIFRHKQPFFKNDWGRATSDRGSIKWKFNKIEGKNQCTFPGAEDFLYFA